MARTRTWTAAAADVERERTRQVARIGNNLNQIARWANTHASGFDAVEVIVHLVDFARPLRTVARLGARCRQRAVLAGRNGRTRPRGP